MEIGIGSKYTISLKDLFESYSGVGIKKNNNDYVQAVHGQVVYATDDEPDGYYDFYDAEGLECCDGETVIVDDIDDLERDNRSILLHSSSAGSSECFSLDEDEFEICCTPVEVFNEIES